MAFRRAIMSYRPSQDVMGDIDELIEWCNENGSGLNSVINSFMPAIAYAVTRLTIEDPKTGKRYVKADFGDVFLRPKSYRVDPFTDESNEVPTLD